MGNKKKVDKDSMYICTVTFVDFWRLFDSFSAAAYSQLIVILNIIVIQDFQNSC